MKRALLLIVAIISTSVCQASPSPSMYVDAAAMALDVYNDVSDKKLTYFTRIISSGLQSDGYYGAAYVDNIEKPHILVFAHRGTSSFKDYIEDWNILKEKAFAQISSAKKFELEAEKFLVAKYGFPDEDPYTFLWHNSISIFHTGHSLGAVIATVLGSSESLHLKSMHIGYGIITFENPGSKNILQDYYLQTYGKDKYNEMLKEAEESTVNIQAHENIIDTLNEQTGNVYICNVSYNYEKMYDTFFEPYDFVPKAVESLFYISYSLNQHLMEPLYLCIEHRSGMSINFNYPYGVQKSYLDFLDANKHPRRWKEFFYHAWEIEMMDDYSKKEDFETMYRKGLKALEQARQKGMGANYMDENRTGHNPVISPNMMKKIEKIEDELRASHIH